MADFEPIVPGSGIINDTEEGSEIIIPGSGIYVEQEVAAAGIGNPLINSGLVNRGLINAGLVN